MEDTTTTTIDALGNLGDRAVAGAQFLVRILLVLAILAVVAGMVRWWVLARRDPDRWTHHDDGTIHGPWLARRRVAHAFQPLVHLTTSRRHPQGPTLTDWQAFAARVTARQERQMRRVWRDVRGALQMDARFQSYTVSDDRRVLGIRVGDVLPDVARTTRRLSELDVLAHHPTVTIEPDPTDRGAALITILDAAPEPIEVLTKRISSYHVTTTVDGITTTELVNDRPVDVWLVTGTRWRSLIDPDTTWDDPTEPDEDSPVMQSDPLPDRGGSGLHVGQGPDRTDQTPFGETQHNGQGVRLYPSQTALIRHLVLAPMTNRGTQVSQIATALNRDQANVRRSLKRLAAVGLAALDEPHGRWTATELARRTVVADMPDPTPIPEPAQEGRP